MPRPLVVGLAGLLLGACAPASGYVSSARSPQPVRSTPTATISASPSAPPVALHPFDPRKHPNILGAIEFIRGKVDVPVALPPNLPAGLRLHPTTPVYRLNTRRPGWVLWLDFGRRGRLFFQYGASAFDGCGGDTARPIEVRGQPPLILTKDHDVWTQLIWPAVPGHLTGRYGITGSLTAQQIIGMAQSMPLLPGRGSRTSC